MAAVKYINNDLHLESTPITQLAKAVGTPFYCYSSQILETNFADYKLHFGAEPNLICYAVKSNSNQAIISRLAALGAGADVVSEGELRRALLAGIPASKIVFSGVGKTAQEIEFALSQNILQFNVESEPELELINRLALDRGTRAPVAFRINPDIDADTHAKISTGKAGDKFGIPWADAEKSYAKAASLAGIHVQGVDMHIGSQLTNLDPLERALRRMATLTANLKTKGHTISVLDIGGGLGIPYDKGMSVPGIEDYAALTKKVLGPFNCRIIVEPGRSLVGEAGFLITRVTHVKECDHRNMLIVDAGMNDLIRPSFYDAYHEIIPVTLTHADEKSYQIVGPVCETADTFGRNRVIQTQTAGDLIAIKSAGAYGAVMSSTYNTRPLAAEILVEGDHFRIIRPRQSYDELIGLDSPDSPWQISS